MDGRSTAKGTALGIGVARLGSDGGLNHRQECGFHPERLPRFPIAVHPRKPERLHHGRPRRRSESSSGASRTASAAASNGESPTASNATRAAPPHNAANTNHPLSKEFFSSWPLQKLMRGGPALGFVLENQSFQDGLGNLLLVVAKTTYRLELKAQIVVRPAFVLVKEQ